ncbi:autotransporter domain-containing protein [Pleomorphomonas sp. JP5]|uniref:autotransporter outer membrane beta-barrel domain-containing protein n=1 Tax=Pleomorphomonas sp. JP5 TaxID=2942998 RepID=UPI002042CEAE|nr:autotransporter domain-containing protein [Pleomorphomonas sp. JP5]MCM5557445.1 autotransporter domain-containing protein [Pleomorphomonas sp. JP5]
MVPIFLALSGPALSNGLSDLRIGESGNEIVTIVDSQAYSGMAIGYAAGSGTLGITGAGAVLAISFGVNAGVDGAADMTVSNGGSFSTNDGSFYLGGAGTLRVQGTGTLFEIGTKTTGIPADYPDSAGWLLTHGGSTLNVSDGATLRVDGLYVGDQDASLATMTATGKGTTIDAQLVIMVGGDGNPNPAGNGLLTIADGATARASVIAAGVDTSSPGTIVVTGAGSSLTSFYNNATFPGKVYAGFNGDGTIIVQNGAALSSDHEIRIAWGAASTGKLIVGGDSTAEAAGSVTAAKGVVFGDGAGQLIFNHTSADYVFAPSISGAGEVLVKAGTTTLSGTNTYTGGTLLSGGKLSVTGSLSGSATGVKMSGATLDGSGSIAGTDYGVWFDTTGNVFTASGSVSGGTASVYFNAGNNTLNFEPGVALSGVVDYRGTTGNTTGFGAGSYSIPAANYVAASNTITLNNAKQTLVLEHPDTSGYINVVAIPGASQAASQYTSSVSDVVGSILALDVARPDQASVGGSTISALQYGEDRRESAESKALRDLGGGLATDAYGNLYWARAFGGLRYQPSRGGDDYSHTAHYGIISGVDHQFENYRLGFFGGGGGVRSVAGQSVSTMNGATGFLGVYGAMKTGDLQWNASLTGGAIENRASRSLNGGTQTASGDFMGWYVSPEIAVSGTYQIAPGWELTPSAKARYTGAFYDGYSESGSSQNVTYDARQSHTLDGRLQVELKRKLRLPSGLPAAVIATASVSDTQALGSSTTRASLLNNEFSVSSSADRNVAGASLGLGFDAMLSERTSVYGSVDGTVYTDDSMAMSGRLGLRVAF